jgi:hypothetical protein
VVTILYLPHTVYPEPLSPVPPLSLDGTLTVTELKNFPEVGVYVLFSVAVNVSVGTAETVTAPVV